MRRQTKNNLIIMEQTKFTRFKRIVTSKLFIVFFALLICFGSLYITTCNANASKLTVANNIEYVSHKNAVSKINDTIQIKANIESKLIDEVNDYIRSQAPKSHQFIPKYLVQAGLEHNIDICFMMAQTQIETNFGTTGAGRESSRRSMFGVIKCHYPNYESAINHYCEVLKTYYLVKGRTEQNLMVNYVTASGGRYAGNPRYEVELRTAYNRIKRITSIHSLQEEYNKF